MEVFRKDVQTGLFVLVGLALFVYAIVRMGSGQFWGMDAGRRYVLDFDHAALVDKGAEVYYLGKRIGKIQEVRFAADGLSVEMVASVNAEPPLFAGTRAEIVDKSALGGKLVVLVPPDQPDTSRLLGNDAPIPGKAAASLTEAVGEVVDMLASFKDDISRILAKTEKTMSSIDQTVLKLGPQIDSASGTLQQTEETMIAFRQLAEETQSRVAQLGDRLEVGLDGTLPEIKTTLASYQALSESLQINLNDLKGRVQELIQHTDHLVVRADGLLTQRYSDLNETLTALNGTVRHLERFSERVARRPSALVFSRAKELEASASAEKDNIKAEKTADKDP